MHLHRIRHLHLTQKHNQIKHKSNMSHHISSVSGADLDSIPIRKALLSVFDKTGIVDLARNLESAGVEILSTGGTAKALTDAGISIKEVSEYTGSPEILDGRVKTLNPKIHGGLLAVRGNSKHTAECAENDISEIDLLVMNLYPFNTTGILIYACFSVLNILINISY